MRLADLNPQFLGSGGGGRSATALRADGSPALERHGVGVMLDCPCGCEDRLYVPFAQPLDGGEQVGPQGWQRTGDTFETLTLTPSILRRDVGKRKSCGWHGYITNGEIRTV